jgi:hypothetical protein
MRTLSKRGGPAPSRRGESSEAEALFDRLWGLRQGRDPLTISERCRGCDYIGAPGSKDLGGEDVGVALTGERCPKCGGRMQRLFLQLVSKKRRGIARADYVAREEEGDEND